MKLLAAALAGCLAAAGVPPFAAARATASTCATSAARVADAPKLSLPEDAKVTSKTIAFEIDIGSDGHVRGLQLVQSSGDAKVDLEFRQALAAAAYEPPQTGCVAYSGGLRLAYSLSPDGPSAPTQPAQLSPTCTPYISAFLTPSTRDRKRTGSAVVAVDLDASGTRGGAPALRKSTGSSVLDAEALRIATTGHYSFLRLSPCTPQAFTYLLDLTFQ